jgi:hypothetical protein
MVAPAVVSKSVMDCPVVKRPGVGEKDGVAATGGGGGGVVPEPVPLPLLQPISVRRARLKLRAMLRMEVVSFGDGDADVDRPTFGVSNAVAGLGLRHGEV